MLESIIALDKDITLFLNNCYTPWSDSMWMFITARSTWLPLYALIIIALYWHLGFKRGTVVVLLLLASVGFCDFTNTLIKKTVCRLRPCFDPEMIDRGVRILEAAVGTPYGFFSAHSSVSFTIATASYQAFKLKPGNYMPYAIFIYVWACVVAISRVFVAKHFLGDLVAGAFYGVLLGFLFSYLTKIVLEQLEKPRIKTMLAKIGIN